MTPLEDLDETSTGNSEDSPLTDPVMQWGLRWPDGKVDTVHDQEAARHAVGYWNSRAIEASVVSRICGPWRTS